MPRTAAAIFRPTQTGLITAVSPSRSNAASQCSKSARRNICASYISIRLAFTPEALRHLVATTDPNKIVMGTDYPYPWTTTSVDHILSTPGLTNAHRRAILGETASKLLGLPPKDS